MAEIISLETELRVQDSDANIKGSILNQTATQGALDLICGLCRGRPSLTISTAAPAIFLDSLGVRP